MAENIKKLVQNMPNSELVKTAKICMSDTYTSFTCPGECPFTDGKFDHETVDDVLDEGRACWEWIFVELAERLGNVDIAYERGYYKGHEDATKCWTDRWNNLVGADILKAYEHGYYEGREDATKYWKNRDNYLGSADISKAYERGYFKGHEDATRHWADISKGENE